MFISCFPRFHYTVNWNSLGKSWPFSFLPSFLYLFANLLSGLLSLESQYFLNYTIYNKCMAICCVARVTDVYSILQIAVVQSLSRVQLFDSVDCSTPGFPVPHDLLEFAQTRVHQVDDAIQPSHPLLPPSPPAPNPSQHQGLFQ